MVANQERVLAQQPLPIAGLMSGQSVIPVREAMDKLLINSVTLGSAFHDPFMALEVIPK